MVAFSQGPTPFIVEGIATTDHIRSSLKDWAGAIRLAAFQEFRACGETRHRVNVRPGAILVCEAGS